MIKVTFAEPTTPEWVNWKTKGQQARDAAAAAVAAGKDPEINDRLYKEMKQTLLDAFFGKCAYCESKITADQPGDVEHYRPKSGVTDANDQPVMIKVGRRDTPHPGYYWLAYDWQNLIPCCRKCNSPTKAADGGRIGKGTRFPVKGFRATKPGEEAREEPLFLNPLLAEPATHFQIDETGIMGSATDEGQTCIKLLGLNRDGLIESRKLTYMQVQALVQFAGASAGASGAETLKQLKVLSEYKRGEQPYAFTARVALKKIVERLRPWWDALNG